MGWLKRTKNSPRMPDVKSPEDYRALGKTLLKVLDKLIDASPKETDPDMVAQMMNLSSAVTLMDSLGLATPLSAMPAPILQTSKLRHWSLHCEVPLSQAEKPLAKEVLPVLDNILKDQKRQVGEGLKTNSHFRLYLEPLPKGAPLNSKMWSFSLNFITLTSPEEIKEQLSESRDAVIKSIDDFAKLATWFGHSSDEPLPRAR